VKTWLDRVCVPALAVDQTPSVQTALEDDDEYEDEGLKRRARVYGALLTEQPGDEFVQGWAPNFHGMDLIRV
jgi:hypothetical protein